MIPTPEQMLTCIRMCQTLSNFYTDIHLQIINGKIWIQRDGTEDGIATDLLAAGIPKEQIVLAFKPEHIRPYTEFAVT